MHAEQAKDLNTDCRVQLKEFVEIKKLAIPSHGAEITNWKLIETEQKTNSVRTGQLIVDK